MCQTGSNALTGELTQIRGQALSSVCTWLLLARSQPSSVSASPERSLRHCRSNLPQQAGTCQLQSAVQGDQSSSQGMLKPAVFIRGSHKPFSNGVFALVCAFPMPCHDPWESVILCIANQFRHASGERDNLRSRATRSPGSTRDSLLPFFCLTQVRTDLR